MDFNGPVKASSSTDLLMEFDDLLTPRDSVEIPWSEAGIPFDGAGTGFQFTAGFQPQLDAAVYAEVPSHAGPTPDACHVVTPSQDSGPFDIPSSRQTSQPARRRKFTNLDWEARQKELRQLYLVENKTLAETMKLMKERHSFVASEKLYKIQFKKWEWQKNLPATHARFMVHKAEKRRLEESKETVFLFGGQEWDYEKASSSFARHKESRQNESDQDPPTPAGVRYETPEVYAHPPPENPTQSIGVDRDKDFEVSNDSATNEHRQSSSDESSYDDMARTQQLRINSDGMTRTRLLAMRGMAQTYKSENKLDEAEAALVRASQGFSEVMGPTHAETNTAKYECASFYAERGGMDKADSVLDDMTREHIETWGHEHKRTMQHVLHTVELLGAWNRSDDALGFLSRSKEITESIGHKRQRRKESRCGPASPPEGSRRAEDQDLEVITEEITQAGSTAKIKYGIEVARSHVKANNEASETLLKAMLRHCESHPEGVALQHLQALAELLDLYRRVGNVVLRKQVFASAEETVKVIFDNYDWDAEKFQSTEVMEAAMQVAANLLKAEHKATAAHIFRRVDDRAKSAFGGFDERTIWILITIGLAYQSHTTWEDAEVWFNGAFTAATERWGPEDGTVKSLQNAMDKRYFSYLSDEGRPFKTIFGVSGLTIRPGRLHLD